MRLGTAFVEIRGDASKLTGDIGTAKSKIVKAVTGIEKDAQKVIYSGGKQVSNFRTRMNNQWVRQTQQASQKTLSFVKARNQQQLAESKKTMTALQSEATKMNRVYDSNAKAMGRVQTQAVKMNNTITKQRSALSAQRSSFIRSTGSMDKMHESANMMNKRFDGLSGSIDKNQKSFGQLTLGILKSAPAFALATAAISGVYVAIRILRDTIVGGLGAVEDFRLKTASMAAFLTTFADKAQEGGVVADIYKRAKIEAAGLVSTLEILDARTIATSRDLTTMAEQFIKSGVKVNLTNEKTKQSFVNIANAVKLLTAGQNQEVQLRQEIRSLAQGQLRDQNVLVKTLQAIDPEIKSHLKTWKQTGDVIEKVGQLLSGFNFAAKDLEKTWSAIGTSLTTMKDRILRGGMLPIYEDLLKWAQQLRDVYIDQNGTLTEQAKILQKGIGDVWSSIKTNVSAVSNIITKFQIDHIVKGILAAKVAMLAFNVAAAANPLWAIPVGVIGLSGWAESLGKALALAKEGLIDFNDIVTANSTELAALIKTGEDAMLHKGQIGIDRLKKQLISLKEDLSSEKSSKAFQFGLGDKEKIQELETLIKSYTFELKFLETQMENVKKVKAFDPLTLSQQESIKALRETKRELEDQLNPIEAVKRKWQEKRDVISSSYESQKNSDKRFRVSLLETSNLLSTVTALEKKELDGLAEKTDKATGKFDSFKASVMGLNEGAVSSKFEKMRIKLKGFKDVVDSNIFKSLLDTIDRAESRDISDKKTKDIAARYKEQENYVLNVTKASKEYSDLMRSTMPEQEKGLADINAQYDALRNNAISVAWETGNSMVEAEKAVAEARQRAIRDLEFSQNRAVDVSRVVSEEFKSNFTDALLSLKDGFEGFGDFVQGILENILRRMVEVQITAPLVNAISGTNWFGGAGGGGSVDISSAMGGGGGAIANAHGNAFSNGKVQAFASGGIVDKPTFFASGGTANVMGEAGTEAILPLKRGKGGDLGVQASMGGGEVNVMINNMSGAESTTEETKNAKGGKDIIVTIKQAIANDIYGGGMVGKAVQNTTGTRMPITQR